MNESEQIITLSLAQSWLAPRPRDAHKGLFGHVLVVGGDYGMPGAVHLAAMGALRVGAGLVTVATRPEHVMSTVCGRPELLCYGIHADASFLDDLLAKATVVVLGPGLGQSAWSEFMFDAVLSSKLPLIIDADGLNWLARADSRIVSRAHWILTPHPGEAARLLNLSSVDIQANRQQAIALLQQRFHGVTVLKGANSLIATKDQPLFCANAGNPGMSSAGMGDLLSGMIAGLVAQKLDLWQAAVAGVLLHASAGDIIASKWGERGMLASDLLIEVQALVNGR